MNERPSIKSSEPPKIFETNLILELKYLKQVLIGILNTIYFQRSLGNVIPTTIEIYGITFPMIKDKDLNNLIESKVDLFCKSLSKNTTTTTTSTTSRISSNKSIPSSSKPHRIILALYPTQRSPPHRSYTPPLSASPLPAPLLTSTSHSNSRNQKSTPLPFQSQPQTVGTGGNLLPSSVSVSNALNWFRDSAKEVLQLGTGHGTTNTNSSHHVNTNLGGGGRAGEVVNNPEGAGEGEEEEEEDPTRTPSSGFGSGSTKGGRGGIGIGSGGRSPVGEEENNEEEEEEVISEEELERREREREEFGEVWESWIINVLITREENLRGDGEEKLRLQLNEFLLRTVMFVNSNTNHIPPITNAELQPHGIQILLNPPSLPFKIPKVNDEGNNIFPELFKLLTAKEI